MVQLTESFARLMNSAQSAGTGTAPNVSDRNDARANVVNPLTVFFNSIRGITAAAYALRRFLRTL